MWLLADFDSGCHLVNSDGVFRGLSQNFPHTCITKGTTKGTAKTSSIHMTVRVPQITAQTRP